jgi:preprotein translocase subunit SecB
VNVRNEIQAGYRLERVHVAEQEYRLVVDENLPELDDPNDREVNFGWDWRPLGPRRFEVVIEINCGPVDGAPEIARVRLFGVFEAVGDVPTVSFAEFIRANAPAILFPYAREVISTMTGRGPHGTFHLNPLNVAALIGKFDIEKTSGARFLAENPAIAESFGLEYRAPAAIAVEPALGSGIK